MRYWPQRRGGALGDDPAVVDDRDLGGDGAATITTKT